MTKLNRRVFRIAIALTVAVAAGANAKPVIYTLRTVADGQLGKNTFFEALITIRMKADTKGVQQQAGSNGGVVYTNSGPATVTISVGGSTAIATFAPGEVYVRYDTGSGIAGFGSSIGPSYPVALGCDDAAFPSVAAYVHDCAQGDWVPPDYNAQFDGIASALADVATTPADRIEFSAAALALPASLSESTLVTGRAHTCATTYTMDDFGYLLICSGAAPRGLHTDRGGFYLQDRVGGSDQWYTANTGSLQVEVMNDEHSHDEETQDD